MPKTLRTRFLIKKDFQLRYMGTVVMVILVTSLLTGFLVSYALLTSISRQQSLGPVMFKTFTLGIVILSLLLALFTIFISHRIAGPVYRMEQITRKVNEGDLNVRVKLRRSDELKSLGDHFNYMLESIHRDISREKSLIRESLICLKDLKNTISRRSRSQKLNQQIQKLEKLLREKEKNLSRYLV